MSSGADAFEVAVDRHSSAFYSYATCTPAQTPVIAQECAAARAALLAAHAAAVAEAEARGRAEALREVDEACTAIDLSAPARGVSLVFPPSGPRAGQWVCWGQPGDKASDATPTAAILRLAAALRAEAQP